MQQGRRNREVQKSPQAYENVTEGFLLSIDVKEGKKSWACIEKFHFCAPEYYRAGTRMAAQRQQQKSYNRPLHFFPYEIAILLSRLYLFTILLLHFFMSNVQCAPRHKENTKKILTTLMLSIGLGLHKHTSFDVFCTSTLLICIRLTWF